jgi:type IX secretion system PorP/SprF family membrane protein
VLLLLAFAALPGTLAQEQVFFIQHLQNRMLYNPAFAGDRAIPGFAFHSRQQWLSWEGNPSSSILAAHTRLKNKNAGLGISLACDGMGPVCHAGFTGIYSYALRISDNSSVTLGLQGELRFQQIRFSQLQLVDQGDQLFSEDPGLKLQPNFGLGMVYRNGDYTVSLSMPRILNAALSPFEGASSRWSRSGRVLYMGASSGYDLGGELTVEPSVLVALAAGSSPLIELAGHFHYRETFRIGVLYRFNRTIGGVVGYRYRDMFLFGYSYDLSIEMVRYNAGTHELFLGYNFPFNRTKTLSPRRF